MSFATCLVAPALSARKFFPAKRIRNAPFQEAAIDTGVGQIGQVHEFNQLQAEGDDHRPAAVNDEKHQLLLAVYLYSSIWIS